MTRHNAFLLALVATMAVGCAEPPDLGQHSVSRSNQLAADDQAVIDAVLRDFAGWKEATFGNREGILAIDLYSANLPYRTLPDMRQLLAGPSNAVSDELIVAFLERNEMKTTIAPLVAASRWARIDISADDTDIFREVPDWAKAFGSVSMPGFSPDRTRALIQINHSWSIHGAVVTYVLTKQDDIWKVENRNQAVFP